MGGMRKLIRFLLSWAALTSAAYGLLNRVRIGSTRTALLALPKLLAGALAPILGALGLVAAVGGVIVRAPLALLAGVFGAWSAASYVWGVVNAAGRFDAAFGPDWHERLPAGVKARFLPARWNWRLPAAPEPRWEQDVPFWPLAAGRELLCDIWQPPVEVPPSGLAFIYMHGSAWTFLDKDFGTRPLFRHLAGQGHVIMDVAYRLCPDTDWRGMLDDVQHAVAWMKANGHSYGVRPDRIVLAGGSAGAHLALLAAYAADEPEMAAADLNGVDLSVCGVVSFYGPTDLTMAADRESAGSVLGSIVGAGQRVDKRFGDRIERSAGLKVQMPAHWDPDRSTRENIMRSLLGGSPEEKPEAFRLASPITHVSPSSPPTLLLYGAHDSLVPASDAGRLAARLRESSVPVVSVVYPMTEHAFDIVLPQVSPAAQAAFYETERFLALLAAGVPVGPKVAVPAAAG
jgi:acetyl esterase/lipase